MTPDRSAVLALVGVVGVTSVAHAGPDLVTSIEEVAVMTGQSPSPVDVAEGCAGGTDDRTLVRFGVRFSNVGTQPLVIGDPGCPDCALAPGAACAHPQYECSPSDGHNHPHYIGFARYELFDLLGRLLGLGGKRTFCARDDVCPDGVAPRYTCDDQGLTAGCADYYPPTLGCQYVDATGVPDVERRALRLRVTFDPDRTLPDADRSNDVTEYLIAGCGDGVVQEDEDCDPGLYATQPCCDATCRLRDDGTPCRDARTACDAADTCDGVQPDCREDPTAQVPGCAIDGRCVPPGALSPAGCSACDPARAPFTWTPLSGRDGIRCRIDEMAGRVWTACTARTAPRAGRRLAALASRLGRQHPRRFVRAAERCGRALRRMDCLADDAASLLEIVRAYAGAAG